MARAKDYMLTDRERELRKAANRRRRIIGGSVLALTLAGFFGAHPVGGLIKGWQARRHAQRAFALIDEEKWLDARNEATAAYQLRAGEPEAVRAVARFLSRTRQPQALEFWDQLSKLTPLTRTDLRDEAAVALSAGDDARAAKAIEPLVQASADSRAADWLLGAQLAAKRNAPIQVHEALQKAWAHPQVSAREKLQAALLENAIASGHEDWRAEAWARIRQLSEGTDAVSLDALVVLGQTLLATEKIPDGFPASFAEIAKALEAHPLARAPQKLLAVDLIIKADPAQKATLVAAATVRWKDAEASDAAALATWLNGKGEFERQLAAIPVERGLRSRDLFLQHVDALGALGRWAEIKTLLEGESYPLDPVIAKMYLARCNAQLGEKTAALNNWQRAVEAARGDTSKLITLAGYAEKNGALEIANSAYEEACGESPRLRPAQQGRLRMAQARGDTAKMHAVLADMLKLWPSDTSVENDEAYLSLLRVSTAPAGASDPVLAAIERLAMNLVEREPTSFPHRTLLALARLRQNRGAEALAVYDKLQVAPGAVTPSALAVHAAVLAANGNNPDAEAEAKQIPAASLLTEERSLIAALVRPKEVDAVQP